MKVQIFVSLIEKWSNPFQRAEELVSFSEDVKQDLLKARKIVEKQLQKKLLITGFYLKKWDSTNQSCT